MKKLPPDAYEFYLSLGPERSYQAVATRFGVNKRTVTGRATKDRWQERLLAHERELRERGEKKALESLESMNARHLACCKAIQMKGMQALRNLSLDSAIDAARAVDLAIRHERLIRGEPSERSELSVEEILKRQWSRWMTPEGDDQEPSPELPLSGEALP